MNYRTELMVQILKSEKAQEIIDEVSQIYGNSYVGLWLFQAIGTVLDELSAIVEGLPAEFIPITASWALDYWEDEYGFPKDNSLTIDERRQRFIRKFMDNIPQNNPAKIEALTANVLNIPAEDVNIIENTAKNTFSVKIRQYVDDLSPAKDLINQRKPSHLIYDITVAEKVDAATDIKVSVAVNTHETFEVDVLIGDISVLEKVNDIKVAIAVNTYEKYEMEVL